MDFQVLKESDVTGGPTLMEIVWRATRLPELSSVESIFEAWSRRKNLFCKYLLAGALMRFIQSKPIHSPMVAPSEIVFSAGYMLPDGMEVADFMYCCFAYRTFLGYRYCKQIYVSHSFELLSEPIQSWLLEKVCSHFKGQSAGGFIIQGSEESWEAVTRGKYRSCHDGN